MKEMHITTPLDDRTITELEAGDRVYLTGIIYTARDAAHERMMRLIEEGKTLPFDIKGQVIYYTGPTPPRPGQVIGSVGPTTSGRMDSYTPKLLDMGLKGMIGKGGRSKDVIESMIKNKAVYMVAVGGAGAKIARCVKESSIVAFEDLGPEAIYRLMVENFPAVVAIDCYGNNQYEIGIKMYGRNL
ncbi:MAG: Fe-S-containing hydro-lyase [Thermoanaerobacteraceae bacterium]|nr:Fe-S-containing hydro-lyase [Thermoanaerobacteraceae bacterium]